MVTIEEAQQQVIIARQQLASRRAEIATAREQATAASKRVTSREAIRSQDIRGLTARRAALRQIAQYGESVTAEEQKLAGQETAIKDVESQIESAQAKQAEIAQQQRDYEYAKKLILKGDKGYSIALSSSPSVRKIYTDIRAERQDLVNATLRQIDEKIGDVSAQTRAIVEKTIYEKGRLDNKDIEKIKTQIYAVEKQPQPTATVTNVPADYLVGGKDKLPAPAPKTLRELSKESPNIITKTELASIAAIESIKKAKPIDYATAPFRLTQKYFEVAGKTGREVAYRTIDALAPKVGQREGRSLFGTFGRYAVISTAQKASESPLGFGKLSLAERGSAFMTAFKLAPMKTTREELGQVGTVAGYTLGGEILGNVFGAVSASASPYVRGAGAGTQVAIGSSFGVASGLSAYDAIVGAEELQGVLENKSIFKRGSLTQEEVVNYRDSENRPLEGITQLPKPEELGFTGEEPEWKQYVKDVEKNNKDVAKQYIEYNKRYRAGKAVSSIVYATMGYGFIRSGVEEFGKPVYTAIKPAKPKVTRGEALASSGKYYQQDIIKIPKTYIKRDTLFKELGRKTGLNLGIFKPTRIQVSPSITQINTTRGVIDSLKDTKSKFDIMVRGQVSRSRILPKTTKFTGNRGYLERPTEMTVIKVGDTRTVTNDEGVTIYYGKSSSVSLPLRSLKRITPTTITYRRGAYERGTRFTFNRKTGVRTIFQPTPEVREVVAGKIGLYDKKGYDIFLNKKGFVTIKQYNTGEPYGVRVLTKPYRSGMLYGETERYQQISQLITKRGKFDVTRLRTLSIKSPVTEQGFTSFKGGGAKTPWTVQDTTPVTTAPLQRTTTAPPPSVAALAPPAPKVTPALAPKISQIQSPKISEKTLTSEAVLSLEGTSQTLRTSSAIKAPQATKNILNVREDTATITKSRVGTSSSSGFREALGSIETQGLGQVSTSALAVASIVTPALKTPTPRKTPETTIVNPPPKIPVIPKIDDSGGLLRNALGKIKRLPAYDVFIRRGGIFKEVGSDLPIGKALKKGAELTKRTLGSTFRVVKDSKSTFVGEDIPYKPESDIFRTYRISRGKRIPLPQGKDVYEFIERRRKRLKTSGEFTEIKYARRSKRNLFGI